MNNNERGNNQLMKHFEQVIFFTDIHLTIHVYQWYIFLISKLYSVQELNFDTF